MADLWKGHYTENEEQICLMVFGALQESCALGNLTFLDRIGRDCFFP